MFFYYRRVFYQCSVRVHSCTFYFAYNCYYNLNYINNYNFITIAYNLLYNYYYFLFVAVNLHLYCTYDGRIGVQPQHFTIVPGPVPSSPHTLTN